MNGDPPPKTHWRQIGIVFACGVLLAVGSCFAFPESPADGSLLVTFRVFGFFAGIITLIIAMLWSLVEAVRTMFRRERSVS